MVDSGPLPQLLEARYRLDEVVAQTAIATVYRAWHVTLNIPIAVKVLRRGAGDWSQIEREVKSLSALNSPNVVRILDYGLYDQQPYLVTDWCAEGSLAGHLTKTGPMNMHTVISWLTPIVSAIAEAHRLQLAHCDIKPSNIMLTRGAMGELEPRVIDFGIAKVFGPGRGTLGTGFSPAFAAPEQVLGESIGPETDVHALGLLFTTCLLGRSPYGEDAGIAALASTRPTPKVFGIDCGPFEGLLAKALALQPGDRYADAGRLLAALQVATTSFGSQATALAPVAYQSIVSGPPAAVLTRPKGEPASMPRRHGRFIAIGGLMLGAVGAIAWTLTAYLPTKRIERVERPSWGASASSAPRAKPTVSLASITGPELERRGTSSGFTVALPDPSDPAGLRRFMVRSNVYWTVFVMDSGDLSALEPTMQKKVVLNAVGTLVLELKEGNHVHYGISGSRALVIFAARSHVDSGAVVDDAFEQFAGDIVFDVVGSSTGADPGKPVLEASQRGAPRACPSLPWMNWILERALLA